MTSSTATATKAKKKLTLRFNTGDSVRALRLSYT
jgi:hypothetical protein